MYEPISNTLFLQLEQALDTGLRVQLEGPGGCVLSTLKDSTGNLSCSRSQAVLLILGALAGKSEGQRLKADPEG